MILMFSWGDPESAILTALDKIRDSTTSKLIFLDYYAPTASPHFRVASKVDVYLKHQTLKNESLYDQDFVGGYIFTDFLAKQMGYDIGQWYFGSRLAKESRHKLVFAWNLGVTRRYRWLTKYSNLFTRDFKKRKFNINVPHRRAIRFATRGVVSAVSQIQYRDDQDGAQRPSYRNRTNLKP